MMDDLARVRYLGVGCVELVSVIFSASLVFSRLLGLLGCC